ncbi:hypothetical protein TNCV_544581 [Trichonephila clavipes]|nr:hypothetical protein TNCV_544581 [Trichonephila clavipes]
MNLAGRDLATPVFLILYRQSRKREKIHFVRIAEENDLNVALLVTDLVFLNLGQVTRATFELASRLLTTTTTREHRTSSDITCTCFLYTVGLQWHQSS